MHGPPPSDSDSDDFDGMSFGHEFEKKKLPPAPPPRSQEDIVVDELMDLLKTGDVDAFRQLFLDNRELIDLRCPLTTFGWTPLMMACQAGHLDLVKFFVVDEGVEVNQSIGTYTPLLLACSVKSELEGNEAAALNNRIFEIVKLLIENKAMVNVRNLNGETALMLAIMHGYDEVAEYLMAHDASLEVTDNGGNTPLFYACAYGRMRIAQILMRQGSLYEIENRAGERPVGVAISKGFEEIAALFPVKEVEPMVPNKYLEYETVEELVPTAFPHPEKPPYAQDVSHLLKGMRLQNLEYLFYTAKIGLPEFLQLTNERMEEIGVEFPYQRDRLTLGLLNIHTAPFGSDSLHRPTEGATLPDIFDSVSSCLKSLIICKASLKFAQREDLFGVSKLTEEQRKQVEEYQKNIDRLLCEIDVRAKNLHRRIKKLDLITPKPAPLHIDEDAIKRIGKPNPFKRIILTNLMTICAFGLMLTIAYKLRK